MSITGKESLHCTDCGLWYIEQDAEVQALKTMKPVEHGFDEEFECPNCHKNNFHSILLDADEHHIQTPLESMHESYVRLKIKSVEGLLASLEEELLVVTKKI